MTKKLHFEIKQNQTKPPKVYVRERETKAIIGSFSFDALPDLTIWPELQGDMQLEAQQFIDNIKAIVPYMSQETGYSSEDIRFRLPSKLLQAWFEISALYESEGRSFDIYEPMVKSFLQSLKTAGQSLNQDNRNKMDFILAKAGLMHYHRPDFKYQNKTIFTELAKISFKSEKLHKKSLEVFQKDKSFSPKSIDNMATGEMEPQRWLSASALLVLIEEQIPVLELIHPGDFMLLCIKPLLDHGITSDGVLALITPLNSKEMQERVDDYIAIKDKRLSKHVKNQ
ncbi:TPA: hypothetical protein JBF89_15400 [Legionella pneumophila]|nr:hypothetical protein [Legionella pneumophila]HAU0352118.1 hypothetical protein [Legionella pneumophila]HAU0355294.1 hypothetical protein [Legionella pneumophila]HAU0361463.1 hypothetical protein [Legionella pneumophila]HAU0370238.1 hypothetical protein [Legionella pneumophila]